MVIPLLLALGITVGMRTMTAMAVLCWFAWTGSVPQTGWAFWVGHLVTVIVFTVFAAGETIGDTLPSTPSRTAPGGWYLAGWWVRWGRTGSCSRLRAV